MGHKERASLCPIREALALEVCVDFGGAGVIADAGRDRDWVGGALQDGAPPLGEDHICGCSAPVMISIMFWCSKTGYAGRRSP